MLSRLCHVYAGTTPNYWLDEHSLEDWQMFLNYGEEATMRDAEAQARITGAAVLYAWAGKTLPPLSDKPLIVTAELQEPDRKKLRETFHFKGGRASR